MLSGGRNGRGVPLPARRTVGGTGSCPPYEDGDPGPALTRCGFTGVPNSGGAGEYTRVEGRKRCRAVPRPHHLTETSDKGVDIYPVIEPKDPDRHSCSHDRYVHVTLTPGHSRPPGRVETDPKDGQQDPTLEVGQSPDGRTERRRVRVVTGRRVTGEGDRTIWWIKCLSLRFRGSPLHCTVGPEE